MSADPHLNLGIIRIRGELRCRCGRPMQPYDAFGLNNSDVIHWVCLNCHETEVTIPILIEDGDDEA